MTSEDARSHSENLCFKKYQVNRENGVSEYAILDNGIVLKYHDRPHYYLYTFVKPGKRDVKQMIKKAEKGEGLNSYVNKNVRDNYSDKWIP